MIFCSRNEDGEPAWKLIIDGRKTVTGRLKPIAVGKILAVQPNRAKKAVCKIKVISCIPETDWIFSMKGLNLLSELTLLNEANLEGFDTWDGLIAWFSNHKPLIRLDDTYRIVFELEGGEKKMETTETYQTTTYTPPTDSVICPWKSNCADEGIFCCPKCKNNTGKKSHYTPENESHYEPSKRFNPYRYPYPYYW